jgi:hypothetical protein
VTRARDTPSTRMRAVPLAWRVAWMMRATTPTRCRSPAEGSSVSALRCATRNSMPPSDAAASIAPSEACRPTSSGMAT